jgi:transporter family-2 protein
MSPMTSIGLFALVFVAGLGIPMMAAMSGQLSLQLGLAKALFIVFSIAFVLSAGYLIYSHGMAKDTFTLAKSNITPVLYMSGAIVVFYMLAVSIVGPQIGIANTIVVVLLGQIISALMIDHFGLFNYPVLSINPTKLLGVFLMVTGIYLARH